MDTQTLFVTVPVGVGLLTAVAFLLVLWRRRDGTIPWFEIGAVYVTVIALYLSYPLIGFLALNRTYTPLNDARLYMMQPEADDMGRIGWLYVCHMLAFAVHVLAGAWPVARGTDVSEPAAAIDRGSDCRGVPEHRSVLDVRRIVLQHLV